MTLEDSLRWVDRFPMRNPYADAYYQTPEPLVEEGVNWDWLYLWDQENPDPRLDSDLDREDYGEAFDFWYTERRKVMDRCWVAAVLPQFRVWDWKEDDVAMARKLVSRHVCGVCGRSDDPGCTYGC